MDEQLKSNISSSASWIRLLFMIFFAICLQVASFVMGAVVIVQFLFVLISGERNEELRRFGASLAEYFFASLKYLTYNSDEKPFPFSEWPDAQEGEESLDEENFSAASRAAGNSAAAVKTSTAQPKAASTVPPAPPSKSAEKSEPNIAPGEPDPVDFEGSVNPDLTAEIVEEIKSVDEHDMESMGKNANPAEAVKPKPKRKIAKKTSSTSPAAAKAEESAETSEDVGKS